MVEPSSLADRRLLSSGSGRYVATIPNSKPGGLELRIRCGEKGFGGPCVRLANHSGARSWTPCGRKLDAHSATIGAIVCLCLRAADTFGGHRVHRHGTVRHEPANHPNSSLKTKAIE